MAEIWHFLFPWLQNYSQYHYEIFSTSSWCQILPYKILTTTLYDDLALWQTCNIVLLKGATLILASPWGEFTEGQRRGALKFHLICRWTYGWANHWDAGDLRRHRAHYDVTVILGPSWIHVMSSLIGWNAPNSAPVCIDKHRYHETLHACAPVFLAAAKQLYDWLSPSVCRSARRSVCYTFFTVPIMVSSWNFQKLSPMT